MIKYMFAKQYQITGTKFPHRFLEAGFTKSNHMYFTTMDLRLLLEYVLKRQVEIWFRLYNIQSFPFIKVEYSSNLDQFNGTHRQLVTNIEHLTHHPLEKLHLEKSPIEEVYIRLYFK